MSAVIPFPLQADPGEMIVKLIKAGYLRPEQRHDADVIADAITGIKRDLRTSGEGKSPTAA
jgi:hypothetical protein